MTADLTLLVGLPASGKTTWAREQLAEKTTGSQVIVGRNELRRMMFGPSYGNPAPAAEAVVTAVQERAVRAALIAGASVIIDDCNLNDETRRRWEALARNFGVELYVVDFFDVSLETCLERNEGRRDTAEYVPPKVIHNMHNWHMKRRRAKERVTAATEAVE